MGPILTGFLTLIASELTISLRKLDDPEYMKHLRASAPGRLNIQRYWRRLMLSSFRPMAIWLAPMHTTNAVKFWISTLERLTLNLADQQLITGLLILVSGLIRYLPSSDYDYNLQVVAVSAIFSTVTHLASVRTLRSYLKEHQSMAIGRLVIVGLTFLLLIGIYVYFLAIFPTFRSGYDVFSYQLALLLWLSWAIGLTVFLSDSALAARKAFDMSKSGRPTIILWVDSIQASDKHRSSRSFRSPVTATALLFCKWYTTAGTIFKFCLTCLVELLFPWYILSYILWAQFFLSLYGMIVYMAPSNDASWGFGQLLPTFLILLPFFTLMETYTGTTPFMHLCQGYSNLSCKRSRNRSQKRQRIQNY
jgi:hypothetical protein